MSNSYAYIAFKECIETLIKKLPKFVSEEGVPIVEFDSNEKDFYALVVILSHAEIESYFEQVASELIHESARKFFKENIIDFNLGYLMFRLVKNSTHRDKILELSNKKLNNFINSITDIYLDEIVDKNHGITSEKVEWIFKSIGKEDLYTDFCDNTQLYINELKSRRGDYVHKSISTRIQEEIDPKGLHDSLNLILREIGKFDFKLKIGK